MCGIGSYFARERTLGTEELRILLNGAIKRGRDGFGCTILRTRPGYTEDRGFTIYNYYTDQGMTPEYVDSCVQDIKEKMQVGDVLLFCARSTPETERESIDVDLQPLFREGMCLVHNGSVTDTEVRRYQEKYEVKDGELDSNTILKAYIHHGRDMVRAIEDLSGSFSVVGYDRRRNMLVSVTGFTPLAHAYIRGVGYFTHSDNEVLGEVIYSMNRVKKDGVNVWEAWYHHDIEPYTIIETDIESGFQQFRKFTPKFLHPNMDKVSNCAMPPVAVVVASGGIDSGVTACVLKRLGYKVVMLHFVYGQKAEVAEEEAVLDLADKLDVEHRVVEVTELYMLLSREECSLLLDPNQDATITGGDMLKSTIAWVPGRNALFANLAMIYAESLILTGAAKKVYIAAGWNQLSEETGGYPDNSYMFNKTLEQLKMCGYITGDKIEFVPVLQRLSKTETWQLGGAMGFPFELTVSCDNPVSDCNGTALCPDCGSTRMSIIAAARAGVMDRRRFTSKPPLALTRQEVRPLDLDALVTALRLPSDISLTTEEIKEKLTNG